MTEAIQSNVIADTTTNDQAFRKIFRRLIFFLFILLVVSFVDRVNIGFAALTMNKDLGLSAAAFGMSVTVFYVAYALFEIPSNLMLAKVGARLYAIALGRRADRDVADVGADVGAGDHAVSREQRHLCGANHCRELRTTNGSCQSTRALPASLSTIVQAASMRP